MCGDACALGRNWPVPCETKAVCVYFGGVGAESVLPEAEGGFGHVPADVAWRAARIAVVWDGGVVNVSL